MLLQSLCHPILVCSFFFRSGILSNLVISNEVDAAANARRRSKIAEIIKTAIEICRGCTCNAEYDSNWRPVHINEWLNAPNEKRPSASCYKCLRSYKNQYFHDSLDRFDAMVVLRKMLPEDRLDALINEEGNPVPAAWQERPGADPVHEVPVLPADVNGRHFIPYDRNETGVPALGSWILKNDRTVGQYLGDIELDDIWGIEGE